ncbi:MULTISPECIES: hypothetical protein [Rhizobium]|uniref:Uncharacterized protein n=1 Tax=Rhizobium favelukesii TaxID=348824 RepID=W6R6L5_9HYPH|nr:MULTISPECIES: hypothetical protein [Rhizobium]MCS0459974.1 hypothetical protein [Rhizobium favelukesii]UFS82289.1 hypothetical protein LPB79_29130 [Rhizobium sp. T136]CDM56025.1 putative predicted protein [Rhizobium favelukesii]
MRMKVASYSGVFAEIVHLDADLHMQLPQQLAVTVAAGDDGVSWRRPEGRDMIK